ncbi:MAG: PqqD family protein [Candidatus Heimdallarchaeota archaeon]|nr:MAG: PqqD family protein [Candidatus Heimdallarchaeota archaeon]
MTKSNLNNEEKKTKEKRKQKGSLVVSKDEFFRLRPVMSPYVTQRKKTEEDLLLELDLRELKKRSFLKRLFPTPDTKKVQLDKLGMEVFLLCDGKHKVKDIIKIFQEKYRLTPTETEISIKKYLMSLTKRHLVGFVIPEKIAQRNLSSGEVIENIILESE